MFVYSHPGFVQTWKFKSLVVEIFQKSWLSRICLRCTTHIPSPSLLPLYPFPTDNPLKYGTIPIHCTHLCLIYLPSLEARVNLFAASYYRTSFADPDPYKFHGSESESIHTISPDPNLDSLGEYGNCGSASSDPLSVYVQLPGYLSKNFARKFETF